MSRARVGLVGARRKRQGLGPFVARDLAAAGAEVICLLGTEDASVAEAQRDLSLRCGVEATGYTSLETMLARERLDALAILSPAETHEQYLRAAAEAGLHVLCEKPLIWGGGRLRERAEERVHALRTRGLLLAENCQWPYTLDAFRTLHPGSEEAPRTFAMRLSPESTGLTALGDCLSHPLSVLQALLPAEPLCVDRPTFRMGKDGGRALSVAFECRAASARVSVEVELRPTGQLPRPASLTIDGRRAEREIRLPEYAFEFRDGDRSVPVPDPLTLRVEAFVASLDNVRAGGKPPDPRPILARMAMLEALVQAYRLQVDEPGPRTQ